MLLIGFKQPTSDFGSDRSTNVAKPVCHLPTIVITNLRPEASQTKLSVL